MLTTAIRRFLETRRSEEESPEIPFSPEDLAVAALMVECARVDRDHSEVEVSKIVEFVRARCGLDRETAECLVALAEQKRDAVWHDWLFTSTVKQAYDDEGRQMLVEHLWEIAVADGVIHDFEAKLVHRIARELEVSNEFVAESRARVARRAGLDDTQG